MSMNRQLAGRLTGRVTKWVVLVVWLSSRSARRCSPPSWPTCRTTRRPRGCRRRRESTRAFEKLAPFQDPNAIPTIVVYHRARGLTEADLAAIEEQAVEIAALDGVAEAKPGRPRRSSVRPRPRRWLPGRLQQRRGGADLGDLRPRRRGLEQDAGHRRRDLRTSRRSTACDVYVAGAGGQAADSAEAFGGHRHDPARRHPQHRHPDPAVHLPQPGPVDPADLQRGRGAVRLARP